jgi:predicted transcriptional regulator
MSMQAPWHSRLSRRERQIMDILFRRGCAAASVVRQELRGDPSLSTVRTQLRILEEKGHVRHEEQGLRYVYRPVTPRRTARRSALRHLVETFFDGSAEQAVAALLGGEARHLTEPELDRIARVVSDAKAAQRGAGRIASATRGDGPDGDGTGRDQERP